MNQYPVELKVEPTPQGMKVKATTLVQRALEGASKLQSELRCIEIDYRITLAAVHEALAAAKVGKACDPRAYWFAGKYLSDFISRLESHGFYLVGKNTTPAQHLGLSKTSVEKIMAFYRRYRAPYDVNVCIPWSTYRDNKEPRKE